MHTMTARPCRALILHLLNVHQLILRANDFEQPWSLIFILFHILIIILNVGRCATVHTATARPCPALTLHFVTVAQLILHANHFKQPLSMISILFHVFFIRFNVGRCTAVHAMTARPCPALIHMFLKVSPAYSACKSPNNLCQ